MHSMGAPDVTPALGQITQVFGCKAVAAAALELPGARLERVRVA
jgi:hypothetical protein